MGQALDGKTVRGASAHGELVHLVGLVRHGCGLVYDQVKASAKLHERRAAEVIFARNELRNTVTTTDALHTCKKQAQQLLAGGGDYVFVVKGNQRTLYDDISAVFTVCRRMARGSRSTGKMKLPRLLTAAMVAPNASRWRAPRRSTPTCPSPASHRWSGVPLRHEARQRQNHCLH